MRPRPRRRASRSCTPRSRTHDAKTPDRGAREPRSLPRARAAAAAALDLVVWPENAVPLLLEDNPAWSRASPRSAAAAPYLVGAPRMVRPRRLRASLRASAFLHRARGRVIAALRQAPPAAVRRDDAGVRRRGACCSRGASRPARAAVLAAGGLRLGPLICYEVIFPELRARRGARRRRAAREPQQRFLVPAGAGPAPAPPLRTAARGRAPAHDGARRQPRVRRRWCCPTVRRASHRRRHARRRDRHRAAARGADRLRAARRRASRGRASPAWRWHSWLVANDRRLRDHLSCRYGTIWAGTQSSCRLLASSVSGPNWLFTKIPVWLANFGTSTCLTW